MVWQKLLFAHYPLDPAALRRLIPQALAIDTFNGHAWLGIVPFTMTIAPRAAPFPPLRRSFHELNVRTYVTMDTPHGPRPGVWFFSLDCANPFSVRAARTAGLPYYNARMSLVEDHAGAVRYHSERRHAGYPTARLETTYRPTGPAHISAEKSLDAFLTERYCLYCPAMTAGRAARLAADADLPPGAAPPATPVRCIDIHHRPWPLAPATARIERNTMADALGMELTGEPLLHYADRLGVYTWPPIPVAP